MQPSTRTTRPLRDCGSALVGVAIGVLAVMPPSFASERPTPLHIAQADDFGSEAQGQLTLKQPLFPKNVAQTSSAIRTVTVTGIGASPDEARRDAARQAVQQVVGLYIDARRQVESKITDQAVSEIVRENILSYSNAYITKLDVAKTSTQSDGLVSVEATVSVSVAPLIKILQDKNVPTVAFDTSTAIGQVDVAARAKQGAIDLYADLVQRSADLVTLSIGTPRVDTSLPASVDHSWLTIPVTYIANAEAIKEWRAKFEHIAAKHMTLDIPVLSTMANTGSTQPCSIPVFDAHDRLNHIDVEDSFLGQHIPDDQEGITACFAQGRGSSSVTLDCFGRIFMKDAKTSPNICQGPTCLSFREHAQKLGMRFELLDTSGTVVDSVPVRFNSFPMLNFGGSATRPPPGASGFFNFCAPNQSAFFTVDPLDAYGEVIVLPKPGERLHAYANFLLPNDVISKTASLRAQVVQN